MSYWNYRVLRRTHDDGSVTFGIHEVYYDEHDQPEKWTEKECGPFGETLEELKGDLGYIALALDRPVLDERELIEELHAQPAGPTIVHAWPGESPEVLGTYVLEAYRVSDGAADIVVRFDAPVDEGKAVGKP